MTCRVLRIDEQLYGCEELPAGQPVRQTDSSALYSPLAGNKKL